MSSLEDYINAIDILVPGDNLPLLEDAKTKAVTKALVLHSKHRPRKVVEDVAGDGGFDYALSDLEEWVDDFSRVLDVEYPVDDTSPSPNTLDQDDWIVYEKPTGMVLRFASDTPDATEDMRITYTTVHTFVEEVSTVAAQDDEAVQALAASFFCRMLAAYYAQNQDSTLAADSVDHKSKRDQYEAQAAKYRKEYDEHLGNLDGKPRPACAIQDQDVDYPFGTDRLTHPRRWR